MKDKKSLVIALDFDDNPSWVPKIDTMKSTIAMQDWVKNED